MTLGQNSTVRNGHSFLVGIFGLAVATPSFHSERLKWPTPVGRVCVCVNAIRIEIHERTAVASSQLWKNQLITRKTWTHSYTYTEYILVICLQRSLPFRYDFYTFDLAFFIRHKQNKAKREKQCKHSEMFITHRGRDDCAHCTTQNRHWRMNRWMEWTRGNSGSERTTTQRNERIELNARVCVCVSISGADTS